MHESQKTLNKKSNEKENISFKFVVYEDELSNYEDSDGLEIDETPSPKRSKRRRKTPQLDVNEKAVLENIEEEIERQLDEKAASTNMTVKNVKNILKHIITNEQVLALVRHSVNDEPFKSENLTFEPKLTRAKVRELYKIQPNNVSPRRTKSEIRILIDQELPEDEEDEEYVPGEEESDDDRSTLNQSDLDSQPPTPVVASSADCGTQTSWTDDGVFKIPSTPDAHHSKNAPDSNENIALRTRSKLSLSDTPLESIEQAFIPPDITTDMYDIDCDDEDWQNFLKEFTQPLQVVAAGNGEDDDEADPEYNILADEEINTVDKEELRADKGVKVTKKELNDLVAELFDFADLFTPPYPIDLTEESNIRENHSTHNSNIQTNNSETLMSKIPEKPPEITINHTKNCLFDVKATKNTPQFEVAVLRSPDNTTDPLNTAEISTVQPIFIETPYVSNINLFNNDQLQLLGQQIRQHIQLTTQHYLQTCAHPRLSFMSADFKEILDEINTKIKENPKTVFNVINFQDAFNLVNNFEQLILNNDPNVKEMESFIQSEIQKFEYFYQWKKVYQSKFAPYFQKTIVRNSTFLYPFLLPVKPFKPVLPKYQMKKNYLPSEDELIAIALEQFVPYVEANKNLRRGKRTSIQDTCKLIIQYLMPSKDCNHLNTHIRRMKLMKMPMNPIYYYYKYKMAPPTYHYVIPSHQLQCIPLYSQKKNNLPEPWKSYIYPEKNVIKIPVPKSEFLPGQKILISPVEKIKNYNKLKKSPIPKRRTRKLTNNLRKYSVKASSLSFENLLTTNTETVSHIPNNLLLMKVSSNSPVKDLSENTYIMLPSMPIINTPVKIVTSDSSPIVQQDNSENKTPKGTQEKVDGKLSEKITSKNEKLSGCHEELAKEDDNETNEIKVNSPVINKNKQKTSILEKKKAKQQKEYETIVSLLSPENSKESEEKATIYAQAYFNKVQERLTQDSPEDYNLFLATLNDHDESSDSVASLYSKVTAILSPKHPDLCEELITFLTPAQAKEIEKLIPHYMYTKMATFLRKLETYYNKQPAQIKKVYNTLLELSGQESVSMEQIKSTMLPLLKGNNFLIDYFLQIFPNEKPPESLMTVWEEIDCDTITLNRNIEKEKNTECFENINIPDVTDPYGSSNCICSCHNSSDEDFSSRNRHCIPCGTKFIQGKVFIQTGKGPRPANVTFPGCSFDEQSRRLSISSTLRPKRRSETASPIKNILFSPTKQSHTESEDDEHAQGKHFKHSPKSRSVKALKNIPLARKLNRSRHKSDPRCLLDTISRNNVDQKKDETDGAVKKLINFSNTSDGSLKKSLKLKSSIIPKITNKSENETKKDEKSQDQNTDLIECDDCNASVESIELKLSPDRSVESLDICEESSQDLSEGNEDVPATCSESENDSIVEAESIHSESSSSDNQDISTKMNNLLPWTREEDKIILKTFQQECDSENTFEIIGQLLPQRTLNEIRERFQTLLDLLLQITKKD